MRGLTNEMRKFLMHFINGHMVVANVWHLEIQAAAKKVASFKTHEFNSQYEQEALAMYRLASGRHLVRRIDALSPEIDWSRPPYDQWGLGDVAELTDAGWEALGLQHLRPSAPTKSTEETALRRRLESEGKLGKRRPAQGSLFE